MLRSFPVLALDGAGADKAAEIQADGLATGAPHGDVDAMIAGLALVGRHALVTRHRGLAAMSARFGFEVRSY